MTPLDLFETIRTPDARIDDLTVYVQDEPVGLVVPSVLASLDECGDSYFYGPRGIAAFAAADADRAWASLIASGAVLFGSTDEVRALRAALRDDRSSRTASYLCAVGGSCREVLDALQGIRHATVAVLGAGGIGSLTAMALAGAGVGHLRLIDHDVVEASNFNRQFFYRPQHIGWRKVDALAEAIRERYPDVQVETLAQAVAPATAAACIAGAAVVVASADEPLGLVAALVEVARAQGAHLVGCGYALNHAGVQFFPADARSDALPTAGLVRQEPAMQPWRRMPQSVMPSFGPTNIELAGLASSLTLMALAGWPVATGQAVQARWSTTGFPRDWSRE